MQPARYNEMKAKIPAIKQLFQSRHYIQCAALCDRYLRSSNYDEIHPVHRACLNFYFALSHDTMAREATIKHRSSELGLAEKHYMAALNALTPPEPKKQLEDIQEFQSPTSSTSEDEPNTIGRRPSTASFDSQHSTASSETSYADDEEFFADWEGPKRESHSKQSPQSRTMHDEYSLTPKLPAKRRPSPIITKPARPTSIYAEQFCADLAAFSAMVELHLASVRELRETAASPILQRLSFSRPRSSTIPQRPVSRDSIVHGDAAGMELLRQSRQNMVFRPRFDPTSVQELCQEALSEL